MIQNSIWHDYRVHSKAVGKLKVLIFNYDRGRIHNTQSLIIQNNIWHDYRIHSKALDEFEVFILNYDRGRIHKNI